MGALRALGIAGLVVTLVGGIALPILWLSTAAHLPQRLDSADDIEVHLRKWIESERQGVEASKDARLRTPVAWPRPEFRRLPRGLTALFVDSIGCPGFIGSLKEEGPAWAWRLGAGALRRRLPGDGACELMLSQALATRLGAESALEMLVASDRIHRFLTKEEMVAYALESMRFERGLIGIDAASRRLFGRPLSALSLAELAELQLAIEPHEYWKEVAQCRSPLQLRAARDALLSSLASAGLATTSEVAAATKQPLGCLSVLH